MKADRGASMPMERDAARATSLVRRVRFRLWNDNAHLQKREIFA